MNEREFYRSVRLKIANMKKKLDELETFINEYDRAKDEGKVFTYPQSKEIEKTGKEFSDILNKIINIKGGSVIQDEISGYFSAIGKSLSIRSIRRRICEHPENVQGFTVEMLRAGERGNMQYVIGKEGLYQKVGEFEVQRSFLERAKRFVPLGYPIDYSDLSGITKEYVHLRDFKKLQTTIITYLNDNKILAKTDERGRIIC